MARIASFEKLLEEYDTKHSGKRGYFPIDYMNKILGIGANEPNIEEALKQGKPLKIDQALLIITALKVGFSAGYRSGRQDAKKK
jgi:hypothetical protein